MLKRSSRLATLELALNQLRRHQLWRGIQLGQKTGDCHEDGGLVEARLATGGRLRLEWTEWRTK